MLRFRFAALVAIVVALNSPTTPVAAQSSGTQSSTTVASEEPTRGSSVGSDDPVEVQSPWAEARLIADLQRARDLASELEVLLDSGYLDDAVLPTVRDTMLAACPVAGTHSFINSWGFSRSGGRRHKGVDMMAAIGVPIAAPVSGVVTHRSNSVGGRSFHLDGDDGNYYYGTHMSGYGASGWVEAGEIIGYVGDDGNAHGIPHLHFEIHPGGGSASNPYPHVAEVCSGAE